MRQTNIPVDMTPIGTTTLEEGLKLIRERAHSAWGAACLLKQGGSMAALETITDDCEWIARIAEMHRIDAMRECEAERVACQISRLARFRKAWPTIKNEIKYIWRG